MLWPLRLTLRLQISQSNFLDVLLRMATPPAPGETRLKSRGGQADVAETGAFAVEVGGVLVSLSADPEAASLLLERGGGAAAVALARTMATPAACRAGLRLLARLADAPGGGTAALCDAAGSAGALARLCLAARAAAAAREKVDWENAACAAIGRLARTFEPFADAVLEAGGLALLVKAARDDIPSRRASAGYALACLAAHKRCRPALVRARCLQLFVALANTSSQRADLADCQRVAGLGLANLCASYHFRAAAARAGALEAATALLKAPSAAVRAGGAAAVAALALHEDNGRRLCFGGALPLLLAMARGGDPRCEAPAVRAVAALALNRENQAALLREGGVHALQYVASSDDPVAAQEANALLHRLRMERLRAGARLAGAAAVEARRLTEEHGSLKAAAATAEIADTDALPQPGSRAAGLLAKAGRHGAEKPGGRRQEL